MTEWLISSTLKFSSSVQNYILSLCYVIFHVSYVAVQLADREVFTNCPAEKTRGNTGDSTVTEETAQSVTGLGGPCPQCPHKKEEATSDGPGL